MPMLGFALLTLTLSRCTEAFVPIGGGTSTHISITGTALLEIVRETCRDVVEEGGHEFEPTVRCKILPEYKEQTSPHQQMCTILFRVTATSLAALNMKNKINIKVAFNTH